MKCIIKNNKTKCEERIFEKLEKKYSILIRDDIKEFIMTNSGGYPIKDLINVDGEEYEIRVFLSANREDKNYYIEQPMNYFLEKTNAKIIPIGIDSGDNYYCVNNETGKVYYWSSNDDKYFYLTLNLDEFSDLFV